MIKEKNEIKIINHEWKANHILERLNFIKCFLPSALFFVEIFLPYSSVKPVRKKNKKKHIYILIEYLYTRKYFQ